MKQLELKHIAAYLPYDLKVKHPTDNKVWILSYDSSKDPDALININATLALGVKPILHPLPDLTRKIEHKGEWFVPIEFLAKIATREKKCYVTNSNLGTCYVESKDVKEGFFIYHPNGYFIWQVGKNSEEKTVRNQYELFQKLLSWHFDIHGLIEAGFAIDANTLNKTKQ